ncbi:c-type cytochrome domain-containing protein, partial [Cyclobacterium plantarum]
MLSSKLKAILGQVLFAVNVFVLFLVVAENRVLIPDWLHVFGRMHPLLLHFPIVIILLALLLVAIPDLLKNKEDSHLYGTDLLLLGTLTAGFTVIAGLLLSHESGYAQEALVWHKWTGLGVFWTASLLYYFLDSQRQLLIKAGSAFLALAVVVSGHLGASITHGDNFITAPLQQDNAVTVSLEEAEVFAHVVYPILENKCVGCHKASKQKGELRMDSPENLLKGGESGPALVPHDLENSLMAQRINLPEENEEHMPPEGKPQLTDGEKAILEAWISSGAIMDKKVLELPDSSSIYSLAVDKFTAAPKSYDFKKVSDETVEELNNFYRKVQPLGLESPALSVSYFGRASFDPESLKDLGPVHQQTVSINLNNMPVGDADLESLAPFANLEKLYLNFASIKGDGLQHLTALENLSLLSLSGNPLDETAVEHLSEMDQLKKLFVWNTNLSGESLEELKAALPGTAVETGTQVSGEVLMLNP